jgi:thiamine-monophosphate kinase
VSLERAFPLEPPPARPHDDEDVVIATLLRARGADGSARDHEGWVDAGDDAAVVDHGLAVTVDALVEGVHFDRRLSPEDVGYKTLAVSVSDLAAVGARPSWAVLALALPASDPAWVDGFARGLADACARWGVRLVGGDTVRTPGPRTASLTLGGTCVAAPRRRSGARPGDDLWVTGTLGLASAGWRLDAPPAAALAALRRPDPPLAFALDLALDGLATAGMDLSDGLARDLPRLCAASRVGAVVDADALPGDPCLGSDAVDHQLRGGEDFQLLFTAPPGHADALRALAARHGVRLTRVGRIEPGDAPRLAQGSWPTPAWAHFAVDPGGAA